jgi:hypothetical protein
VIKAKREVWWDTCHLKEIIKVYRGFCGKPERKRKLGRPRLKREDIKWLL